MSERRYLLTLAAILALALAVRAPFVRTGAVQAELALVGDESNYVFNAAGMLAGTLAEQDRILPWMRAPLPSLVAAGAALLTGSNPAWSIAPAVTINIGLSLALIALVAAITRRLSGEKAALLAALIVALLPAWIFYPQLVLSETLFTTLLAWAIWWALRAPPERPGRHWLMIGALLGLAALCRSTALTLLPLFWLMAWFQIRRIRPALLAAALSTLALGAVVAPWTLRNIVVHGGVILVDTAGAYTLWQDNTTLPRAEVKAIVLGYPGPAERQAFASAAARAEITGDPGRFARNALQRLARAPLPEPATGYRDDWLRAYPNGAMLWAELYGLGSVISYALLAPLALTGGLALWRRGGRTERSFALLVGGLVAHYLFQTATTHYSQRFLVPLFPVFAALAGAALSGWRGQWRGLIGSWAGRAVVAATLLFWIFSWPYNAPAIAQLRADWHWTRGAACQDAADLAQLRAAAATPRPVWRLTTALGRCEVAQGQGEAGIATLWQAVDQAAAMEQPAADAQAALVAAYRDHGDADAARDAQRIAASGQLATLEWAWRDLPPPADSIDAGGLDSGYLRGFYGPEVAPDGRTYRWMGGAGQLRFPGCQPGPQRLSLTAASGHPADSAALLTVGAASLGLSPEWRRFTVLVELDASCAITLQASTWRPLARDPGSNDPRSLGFELDAAAIAPLEP
jgi:4-amino-4-deoxy-L-arabinose transferase-like glycosyltransferase